MNLKLNMRLSEIRRYAVIDRDGIDLGEPIDIALDKTDEFRASHVIIGGGFIEELLEELEKRDNIDEFFLINQIRNIENKEITLKIPESELEKTDATGKLPDHLIKFSTIHRMNVVDNDGKSIGEVVDIEFKEGRTYLVIQDFHFNRNMSMTSEFRQRVEFIVPISKVKINGDTIIAPLSAESRMNLVSQNLQPKKRGTDPIYI